MKYEHPMICPDCGYKNNGNEYRTDSGIAYCDECGKSFLYERCVIITYKISTHNPIRPPAEATVITDSQADAGGLPPQGGES